MFADRHLVHLVDAELVRLIGLLLTLAEPVLLLIFELLLLERIWPNCCRVLAELLLELVGFRFASLLLRVWTGFRSPKAAGPTAPAALLR